MKDTLHDIVQHTHSLGFIDLVKIVGDDKTTELDAMAEDRSVILAGNTNSKVDKGYKIDPRFYPPDKEFNYKRRVFIGNQVKYAVWALEDGRVQRFVQSPEMQEMVKRNFKERRRALISVAGKGGVGEFGSFKGKTYIDYFEVAQ